MTLFLSSTFRRFLPASRLRLLSSSSSFSSFSHFTFKFDPSYWIVESHIKNGHYAYALDAALRGRFIFPSDFPAIGTANLFLTGLLEKRNPSVAVAVWKQWRLLGFVGDYETYLLMIKTYCELQDFSGAGRVLCKEMEVAGLGPYTIFAVSDYLRGLCSNGGSSLAFKILIGQILQREWLPPQHTDYFTVIRGFCWEMKMEAAERVMVAMEARDHWPNLSWYTELINSYSRLGRLDRAAALFGEARREGLPLKASHYTTLISGYRRIEDMDNMLAVFDDMKKNGINPDFMAYSIVIQGLCWVGWISKAEEIVREMVSSDAGTIGMIINRIIEGLYRCGKAEGAEKLVDQRKAQEIKAGL